MNLELLQTVDQSYPEHNDGILDSGSEALTCAFNRRGTLLAVGCNDGRIAIWDFMTRSIARMCNSHIHPITSLSWSRSGRKLLSSSTDWNVMLWDVATGDMDLRLRFPSPILRTQFHPRDKSVFLVCPMKNVPLVVRRTGEEYTHTPLPTDGESEINIVASFDRRGERIVTGSSKGKILIIDSCTLDVLKSFKVYSGASTATAIKSIEFARRGSNFLVNSADRVIRVFDIDVIMASYEDEEPEALQRLQDLVNRSQWKKCTFSGDGEFIVAGSHRQHSLHIWDKAMGSLVKILTGHKGETLLDIVWHPVRPVILSISTGVVNVWSQAHVELWSAYAPNFKELDENEEYEEKEDEFDIEDEDMVLKRDGLYEEGGQLINVTKVAPIPAFCSSEEDDEEPLDWLPIAPEIEEPEDTGWGQLEPKLNEQPVAESGGRKRPAENDENLEPVVPSDVVPPPKQPRTIDINLPNRWEDFASSENTPKESKPKSSKQSKKKSGSMKNSSKPPPPTNSGASNSTAKTDTKQLSPHSPSTNTAPAPTTTTSDSLATNSPSPGVTTIGPPSPGVTTVGPPSPGVTTVTAGPPSPSVTTVTAVSNDRDSENGGMTRPGVLGKTEGDYEIPDNEDKEAAGTSSVLEGGEGGREGGGGGGGREGEGREGGREGEREEAMEVIANEMTERTNGKT